MSPSFVCDGNPVAYSDGRHSWMNIAEARMHRGTIDFEGAKVRAIESHSTLTSVLARTRRHVSLTSDKTRRTMGQIFTPLAVAQLMANWIEPIRREFRFIDAGAGVGMLTAAVCERVASFDESRIIHADAYETDIAVLPALRETMHQCEQFLVGRGHRFTFVIHEDDFVLRRPRASLFSADAHDAVADVVIMNPPYLKLPKDAPQARAFAELIHGQPNLYALFMAAAVELLKPGGELIAISPRSFCNGLYFREFRRWFLARMALRQMHIFESRRTTFKDSDVLQESVITVATRQSQPRLTIGVSSSNGRNLTHPYSRSYPTDSVVDNSSGDAVIRIPSSDLDLPVIRAVEAWSATFAERGLRISTGPVVSFRATPFLLPTADHPDAIPLFSIHNVRPFATVWPLTKGKKPIAFRWCDGSARLVLPARNYVLLRRFSAKEEHRRLTASAYIPSMHERARPIAIENHLNYVTHQSRELTAFEAHGLTALFNSAFLDRYFRTFSGNTQVNATEIRSLPFPGLESLAKIGQRIASIPIGCRTNIEEIVLEELGIESSTLTGISEIHA